MDIGQTETKGTVLLKNASDLLDFSRGEEKQLEGVSGFESSLAYDMLMRCVWPGIDHSISRRSPILEFRS
jgi:hypothetical protein